MMICEMYYKCMSKYNVAFLHGYVDLCVFIGLRRLFHLICYSRSCKDNLSFSDLFETVVCLCLFFYL